MYAPIIVFCASAASAGAWSWRHLSSAPISKSSAAGHVANPAAQDFVIKGRFDLQPATTDAVRRAEADFQHAIDVDPRYAQAYLELARAKLAEAAARGFIYRTELERDSAEQLARKALQLHPNLPDAQLNVAGSHIGDGHPELAFVDLARIKKPFPVLPIFEAMARARAGQREEALRLIRPYEQKYPKLAPRCNGLRRCMR